MTYEKMMTMKNKMLPLLVISLVFTSKYLGTYCFCAVCASASNQLRYCDAMAIAGSVWQSGLSHFALSYLYSQLPVPTSSQIPLARTSARQTVFLTAGYPGTQYSTE